MLCGGDIDINGIGLLARRSRQSKEEDGQTKGNLHTKRRLPCSRSAHSASEPSAGTANPAWGCWGWGLLKMNRTSVFTNRSPGQVPSLLSRNPFPRMRSVREERGGQTQGGGIRSPLSNEAHGTLSNLKPAVTCPQLSKLPIGTPFRLWLPELSKICIFQSLT